VWKYSDVLVSVKESLSKAQKSMKHRKRYMKKKLQKLKINRILAFQILFVIAAFVSMIAISYAFMSGVVYDSLVDKASSTLEQTRTSIRSYRREFEAELDAFGDLIKEEGVLAN
jgi:ribosome recycling factor